MGNHILKDNNCFKNAEYVNVLFSFKLMNWSGMLNHTYVIKHSLRSFHSQLMMYPDNVIALLRPMFFHKPTPCD